MNGRLLIILFMASFSSTAFSQCLSDEHGMVKCSIEPAGGVIADSEGQLLCGKGRCVRDHEGQIRCSKYSGGGAVLNDLGIAYCSGGCEAGSSNYCIDGKQ